MSDIYEVRVWAGTDEKRSVSSTNWQPNSNPTKENSDNLSIHVRNKDVGQETSVTFGFKYKDRASGGYHGEYAVKRQGGVRIPLSMLIEMTSLGLLDSEYRLSKQELRKLLLAIASAQVLEGEGA